MPSAATMHAAYHRLEQQAQRDGYACRRRARPDFAHVAVVTRARRAKDALAPLVADELALAVRDAA